MTQASDLLEMISRRGPMLLRAQTGTGKRDVKPELKADFTRPQLDPVRDRERQAMARLYQLHRLSSYEIAEVFGRERSAVTKHLKRAGVKLRSFSQAAKDRQSKSNAITSPTYYVHYRPSGPRKHVRGR